VACKFCGQTIGATTTPSPAPATNFRRGLTNAGGDGEQSNSLLSRAEKTVYFRIARGFSWFLLIVLSIGLVVNVILVIPELSQAFGASTSVAPQALNRAITSPAPGQSPGSGQGGATLDPDEMARLDKVAYEIIQLLPANSRSSGNVDNLRGQIRSLAANLSNDQSEQLAILQELRDDLRSVPEAEREKAVRTYFDLKTQRIQEAQSKKQAAQQELVFSGASLVSGIALLTLVTMILVLLSVERNTRPSRA